MVNFEPTTLEVAERDGVCHVTLRAERIAAAMVADLEALCAWLDDDCACDLVVFRGRDGRFTRGIDLSDFSTRRPPDIHGFNKWERVLTDIERLKKITFAAIDGECRGGGVQLALACDHRIATPATAFVLDEVKSGFLPGLATWRLAKFVGMGAARWMTLSCQPVAAAEALRMGLVGQVADDLDDAIDEAARAFRPVNGTVVALTRRLLNDAYSKSHEDFMGDFLAAQHRAISDEPFLRRLQEEALRPPPS